MAERDREGDRLETVPRVRIALFARQLALMLDAGINLSQALQVLADGAESESLIVITRDVLNAVEGGTALSVAFARYPRAFPSILRSMVRVGEETGNLSGVLHKASSWMEADHRVYSKLKSALTYPTFVLVAACVLTLSLFVWVVPGLLEVLLQTNSKLPPLTLMVMAITRVATNPLSYFFPVGLAGLVATNWRSFVENRQAMARVWEILMSAPVLGPSLRAATMSRYCFAAHTLLETGSPPTRALDLAAEASGSALLCQDKERVLATLYDGGQASEAFAMRTDLYDARVVQFAQAGEASASLPDMMDRAGSVLACELDSSLERLSSTLEPILLLGIGAIVGTILVSIFLPLYGSLGNL